MDAAAPFALTIAVFLSGCAAMLGLVLFVKLPFPSLLGWTVLSQPYLTVIIGWTALVAMSIAAFVASLGDSSSPDWRWTEKLRGWPTILTIVLVTSGAAASYVSAKRLRVGINGVGLFYSREPEVAIDLPFFQGFSVSPHLKAVAEQLDGVLKQVTERRATTPRTSFLAFGSSSPTQRSVSLPQRRFRSGGTRQPPIHRAKSHKSSTVSWLIGFLCACFTGRNLTSPTCRWSSSRI